MADTIVLTKLDHEADEILDRFEAATGLEAADDRADRRVFRIDESEHDIDIVHELTEIDEQWPQHVGIQEPF